MLAPSDWSRFASYHAVITSYEVIIAGVLNCKVAALRFVNVSAEVVNVVEENAVAKSTKYALEFDGTLFKRGGEAYNDTNNHHNYSNNSFIYRIYNRIRKLLRNYTTIVIRFKLSEHCYIILFISPSANNCQVEEKVVNPRRTDFFGDQFQSNPLFGHYFHAVRFCIVFRVLLFCIILNFFLSVLFKFCCVWRFFFYF